MSGQALLITGGGTGGHIFPGIAIAIELARLFPEVILAFVASGKILESEVLARAGYHLEPLRMQAFRGIGFFNRFKSLAMLPTAVWHARRLIIKYQPGCIIAVGGYAAFPLGVAAWLMRVPLLVQEQNAIPGLTNYLLGRIARQVFICFSSTKMYFPSGKTLVCGNPIRPNLIRQAYIAQTNRCNSAKLFRVLVLGGSQGAHSLNQAVCAALPFLYNRRDHLFFVHQTGKRDELEVQCAYQEAKQPSNIAAFFDNIGYHYGLAHLCICRAGAGTISELTAVGRAAILVPYPFATGDHQTKNARVLEKAGAALIISETDLNGRRLANLITIIMDNPDSLTTMESAAFALGLPKAARKIAEICLSYLKKEII